MQWILKKMRYSIPEIRVNNSKEQCYFDIFLLIIYTTISLVNTSIIFIPQSVKEYIKISIIGNVPSISVIFINLIVLIRINVKLYIKRESNMNETLTRLQAHGEVVSEIEIPTWERRKFFLEVGYVVDAMIGLFGLFYGNTVSKSFAWVVIISLIETFIDNFIEDSAIRYEAIPKVYIKY